MNAALKFLEVLIVSLAILVFVPLAILFGVPLTLVAYLQARPWAQRHNQVEV